MDAQNGCPKPDPRLLPHLQNYARQTKEIGRTMEGVWYERTMEGVWYERNDLCFSKRQIFISKARKNMKLNISFHLAEESDKKRLNHCSRNALAFVRKSTRPKPPANLGQKIVRRATKSLLPAQKKGQIALSNLDATQPGIEKTAHKCQI